MTKDLYHILGINADANDTDIKAAYRKLALRNHPDFDGSDEAKETFYDVAEAYDVLSNAQRRAVYNMCGIDGLAKGIPGNKDFEEGYIYSGDADATFRAFFGTSNPFADILNTTHYGQAPKGFGAHGIQEQDDAIEQDLSLSLEDLYHGCTKKMKITRRELQDGEDSTSVRDKILTVNVKPGWKVGTRITFPKEGDQGPNRIPADIVFVVQETKHDRFVRKGNDLEHTVKLPLVKALVGCTLKIDTLDGRVLQVPMHEVVNPATVKRVPGEGMPNSKKPGTFGDLVLRFEVDFPTSLSANQKSLAAQMLA